MLNKPITKRIFGKIPVNGGMPPSDSKLIKRIDLNILFEVRVLIMLIL
jgi:hypothetical protein